MQNINAPQAWEYEQGSADIVVGLLDSGIDYNHEDLIDNMWTNIGEVPNNNILIVASKVN